MTSTIWIVPLEPIDQRYTKQWYTDVPNIIATGMSKTGSNFKIKNIRGVPVEDRTTPGAFLDFGKTNAWKASQVQVIARMFSEGQVEPGDKFLITDTWNFAVTAIRYMSELMNVPVELHGIWHAGAYDPTDILGMKMSKDWPPHQELAWFYACDYNYFATKFHKDMFLANLDVPKKDHRRAVRSGQPHTFIAQEINKNFDNVERDNTIVFPHRLNDDKQPEIFRDLVSHLPDDWSYVITQEKSLSKENYYKLLSQSKMVFSCSLHENLGISQMEGSLSGCIPVQPERASYSEIYLKKFKYPSEWTTSFEAYEQHREELIAFVVDLMDNYNSIRSTLTRQNDKILKSFMHPEAMLKKLLKPMKL